jgi:molybdopterin converting factor small subunit
VRIEVRLFATLRDFLPQPDPSGTTIIDVPDNATVDDVGRLLGIPAHLARVALVNGEYAEPGDRLHAGDVVTLFPPLAGGSL